MLLLVTGASGVGKSTVRRLVDPQVGPEVECVELAGISGPSLIRDLRWRHRTTELAAQRAVQLEREGRHLLLCGDPVAGVEVIASPSAAELDGIAICLLDADPKVQAQRLRARGDDPALLVHHQAFAEWMRRQAADPLHMLDVVRTDAWEGMRWDRIARSAADWNVHVIDSTQLTAEASASAVLSWIRSVLAGRVPTVRVPADAEPQPVQPFSGATTNRRAGSCPSE